MKAPRWKLKRPFKRTTTNRLKRRGATGRFTYRWENLNPPHKYSTSSRGRVLCRFAEKKISNVVGTLRGEHTRGRRSYRCISWIFILIEKEVISSCKSITRLLLKMSRVCNGKVAAYYGNVNCLHARNSVCFDGKA